MTATCSFSPNLPQLLLACRPHNHPHHSRMFRRTQLFPLETSHLTSTTLAKSPFKNWLPPYSPSPTPITTRSLRTPHPNRTAIPFFHQKCYVNSMRPELEPPLYSLRYGQLIPTAYHFRVDVKNHRSTKHVASGM